jgi:hypothetical protein
MPDSTSTAGAGKTALAYTDITAYYVRAGGALTALTMVDLTTLGTWDSDTIDDKLAFKKLHDTNAPGVYEINLPNNILAAGATSVVIQLRATGAAPTMIEMQLAGVLVGSIANDAITAAAIADNAINAAALDADASTEINAAVLSAIAGIGSGTGAALNFAVYDDNTDGALAAIVAPVGTPTGTFANTLANDGTNHVLASAANVIDWLYAFNVGAGRAASKVVLRAMSGATNDTITVSAYNFLTPGWEVRTTFASAAETLYDIPLLAGHTGIGADAGKVYIRFQFSEADAGTLTIDEAYVLAQNLGQTVGYSDGSIWVDTVNGTAGTTPFVNGTADNPVLTWADALALSAAVGITSFHFLPNSSIELNASVAGYRFIGVATIALANQIITHATFRDCYTISGTSTGDDATFINCGIGTATMDHAYFLGCRFKGVLTFLTSKDYFVVDGTDTTPSAGNAATFIFAASTTCVYRSWEGGIRLGGLTTSSNAIIDGAGRVELVDTCVGGSVTIRGFFPPVVGGAGLHTVAEFLAHNGANTFTQTQRFGTDQDTAGVTETLTRIPDATAGEAGGLFIAGVNASCTITDVTTTGSVGKYLKDILDDTAILPAVWVVPGVGTSTLTTTDVQTYCDAAITANTLVKDLPTNAELADRTLLAAGYATPTNITAASGIALAASQHVIVDSGTVTVSDKTGFKLASDGLDTIATTAPTGAASNFREMLVQVWRRFFRKATRTDSAIITYADNGTTPVTTQVISNDGTTETQGTAT